MNEQQTKELKKAILNLELVVMAMPYHTKLKIAWRGLKKAMGPVVKESANADVCTCEFDEQENIELDGTICGCCGLIITADRA